MKNKFILGFTIVIICVLAFGATAYKSIIGPSSSTDNAVLRYNGTDGLIAQNSGVTVDDSNNVDVPGNLTIDGTMTIDELNVTTLTLDDIFDLAPVVTNVLKNSWGSTISSLNLSNVYVLPASPTITTDSSLTPDFSVSQTHVFVLNNNATVSLPSNITTNMLYHEFNFVFIQGGSGGYTLTLATNYILGTQVSSLNYSTELGSRSYMKCTLITTNLLDITTSVSGYTTL